MAGISFLLIFALIWGFQVLLGFAEGNIAEEIASTGDQRVNLTCHFNSSTDVIWYIGDSTELYNCRLNQIDQCTQIIASELRGVYNVFHFRATRNNETSILSLIPYQKEVQFKCTTGNVILQRYRVTLIDPNDIVPTCTVTLPSSDVNGNIGVALVCELHLGLDVILTFERIGSYIPDTPGLSLNTRTKTLDLNDFTNIHSGSCNAYVPGINITRSCNYPNIVKTQYIADANNVIVECDVESDVDWHLYDSDGREEDIKNRSWTREGGRSLLIRDVSVRDVGKVVVCQPRGDNFSNGTITFTVISENSRDTNEANSGDSQLVPDESSVFFVLTLLFLVLWLITITIGGVLMGCKKSQKLSNTLVISGNEEIQPAPEYDTVIHSTSGGNGLDDDRAVSLRSLGAGSRRMMDEESKTHYMDMDGNHASTDYQTMKSLTYENNILSAGTTGSSGDTADERVTGGTHYVDMSGKNGQNDYEAMKSIIYDDL